MKEREREREMEERMVGLSNGSVKRRAKCKSAMRCWRCGAMRSDGLLGDAGRCDAMRCWAMLGDAMQSDAMQTNAILAM